jgi:hypothetical protein
MTVTAAGWLIEVSEPVAGEDSQAVVDQDSVLPDLGLQLVAQMTSGRGWTVAEDRTHMWAHVTVG